MEKEKPEIQETAGNGFAVEEDVFFGQVPAAGPDHERGDLFLKGVAFSFGAGEADGPADRVPHVDLALDRVFPGRGLGVLEIRHVDAGAGVESVDHHLDVGGRSGDLDAPVEKVVGGRRDFPHPGPDVLGFGQEIGGLSRVDPGLSPGPF